MLPSEKVALAAAQKTDQRLASMKQGSPFPGHCGKLSKRERRLPPGDGRAAIEIHPERNTNT